MTITHKREMRKTRGCELGPLSRIHALGGIRTVPVQQTGGRGQKGPRSSLPPGTSHQPPAILERVP
jgi:hypothetical protein